MKGKISMIGSLLSFMNFLKIEKPKNKQEDSKNPKTKITNEIIELDEKENFYMQKSEIITYFENGKEIKEEVLEEQIPLSKTSAKRQISRQRIQ